MIDCAGTCGVGCPECSSSCDRFENHEGSHVCGAEGHSW